MIFQEPMASLNPCFTVGFQIDEALRFHEGIDRARGAARAPSSCSTRSASRRRSERLGAFPHQMSGGMCQRVMIAMAIACNPKLLIADEPTTALDVTIQAQILDLLLDLQREHGMALIMITHDMGVVAETADRVVVQYAGQQVEAQGVAGLFADAMHPYTAALLAALPERARRPAAADHPRRGAGRARPARPAACSTRAARYATDHCRRCRRPSATARAAAVRCHYPLTGGVPRGPSRPAGLAA